MGAEKIQKRCRYLLNPISSNDDETSNDVIIAKIKSQIADEGTEDLEEGDPPMQKEEVLMNADDMSSLIPVKNGETSSCSIATTTPTMKADRKRKLDHEKKNNASTDVTYHKRKKTLKPLMMISQPVNSTIAF